MIASGGRSAFSRTIAGLVAGAIAYVVVERLRPGRDSLGKAAAGTVGTCDVCGFVALAIGVLVARRTAPNSDTARRGASLNRLGE